MKFEKTEVFGFEHAFRGMRNPLESWARSDSKYGHIVLCEKCPYDKNDCYATEHCIELGENDIDLAKRLIAGGTEHRKFMRQIVVWADITAPLFWWKEFDTYKVGTVANSTSTMHKLTSKPITKECFEFSQYNDMERTIVEMCEYTRKLYLENKGTEFGDMCWRNLVEILPNAWLQTRTVTMNYENLLTMYKQRKGHKLVEWHKFREWVETLPYAKELICGEDMDTSKP